MPPTSQFVRTSIAYCIVFLFLSSILWSGISNGLHTSVRNALEVFLPADHLDSEAFKGYPDFSQYIPLRTISVDELDLDHRRLIIVGDIHGMKSSIDSLLLKLSYKPSEDFLMHLGDTIAKGPNSLEVLSQFSEANVTGVRGNHEQKVIEWRGWIEWIEGQKGGKRWLAKLERKWTQDAAEFKKKHKHQDLKWPIPQGWKFMADHYRIARAMTASQYTYLKSLPLVVHLPSLHTHLVHAGILPFDPKFSPTSSEQPLAHIPRALAPPPTPTRTAQERSLLTDITPNTDPWVLLNMRSILANDEVTRKSKEGVPWSDLWNMIMMRCKGYDEPEAHEDAGWQGDLKSEAFRLPCLPINVIYGHAAGRGLDIKRWSFGLDTGCVYGRNLTAMIITNADTSATVTDEHVREVPFGEDGKARLVSVPCSKQ